jgi:hypothetical protein
MLPWLGLLACCCLQWAQQLQLLPPGNAKAAAVAAAAAVRAAGAAGAAEAARAAGGVMATGVLRPVGQSVATIWHIFFHKAEMCDGNVSQFEACMAAVDDWLAACASSLSVSAAGVDLLMVRQHVAATAAAVHAVAFAEAPGVQDISGVVQQLFALGLCLSAVAHKQCCNNPACINLSGPSELALVKGRSNTCSGCRTARYCSTVCMKQHWKQHRPVCKALAAAAAAAAGAEAVPPGIAS